MTASSISYHPEVDGLRAVAVIFVVLYHMGAQWLPGGYMAEDVLADAEPEYYPGTDLSTGA